MGTREQIVKAATAGREAGERGEPPTACPYPSTSTLRTAWIRGYATTRPLSSFAVPFARQE
ncbi:Rmf/CrpP fold protein [Streptomyces sp. NPDC058308]|uniref:Rmf/CrpP fold protein n=1 Tax=Streptomyces sp. NPDC058308 TaxID=3346440 RepID=UPI0036EE0DD0